MGVLDKLFVLIDRDLNRHVLSIHCHRLLQNLHELVNLIEPVVGVYCDTADVCLQVLIIFQNSDFLAAKAEVNQSMVVGAFVGKC